MLPTFLRDSNIQALMEDKKANIVAVTAVIAIIIVIVVARVILKFSKAFFLICGAGIAVIIAILAYIIIRVRYNRRRRLLESKLVSEGRELRVEYSFLRKVAGVPTKFRYKELEEATDNFRSLLGQGASATVFKGALSDGTAVAVKRIDGDQEHGEKEFRSEVAAIASVQHVNLVHLLGYCISNPEGPRFLVYEFIANGSLDCWIFPKRESQSRRGGCLTWELRYKVAIDVAKALSYLHHDCRSRVLHLDVKPENILLDQNYKAIVADFGLSKLMRKDQSRVVTTVRGTKGYLAPEWLLEQGVSEKSDIYSYGMVLLEMIGGCRNVCLIDHGEDRSERKWRYFPKIVNEKMREGKLMEVVDPRLLERGGVDEKEVRRLVYIALWCIQEKARLRPTMARVVEMLEGRAALEEPPDTRMIIVDLLSIDDDDQQPDGHNRRKIATIAPHFVGSNTPITSQHSFAMSILSPR